MLDEADLRRRHQTVNRLIGNEGAVLLGDYLMCTAFTLCACTGDRELMERRPHGQPHVRGRTDPIRHRGNLAP